MGYLTHVDGRCYVCNEHTDIFCDHCSRYICPEHRVERDIERTFKKFVFCNDCEKEKKQPIKPKRTHGNPELQEGFTDQRGY